MTSVTRRTRSGRAAAVAVTLALVLGGCNSLPPCWSSRIFSDSPRMLPEPEEVAAPPALPLGETASSRQSVDAAESNQMASDAPLDVKPDVHLRGRINADAIFVNQSPKDKSIIGDIQNATGFRRARLGAEGTVGEQVNWVAEFDFAGGNISFKDVYVGLNELPIIRRIRVGHMLEPFSLEGQESSNYFPFMERSNFSSLDPARNWGVGIFSYTEDERATLALAAFRSGTSNNSGDDFGDDNDMAYDVRVTWLPWYDDASAGRYLLHVGGAFSQRYPKNNVVTYNQGPQSTLLTSEDNPGSPFLPKITIPASQNQLYNVQCALVLGSLALQAEWDATDVDQIGGSPVFLHGFYVYASYFLTGENREYLTRDGKFGITRVRSPFLCMKSKQYLAGGPGAWELAGRFSYADFANSNIPLSNGLKVGDREAEMTFGVNWYLNDYARLMFNYTHVVPVDPNFGPSYADSFGIRTAIFW